MQDYFNRRVLEGAYIFIVIKDFEEKNWQKYPVHLFKNWSKVG